MQRENQRRHRAGLKYKKTEGEKWIIDTSKDRGSVRPIDLVSRDPDRLRERDSKEAAVDPSRAEDAQAYIEQWVEKRIPLRGEYFELLLAQVLINQLHHIKQMYQVSLADVAKDKPEVEMKNADRPRRAGGECTGTQPTQCCMIAFRHCIDVGVPWSARNNDTT